LPVLSARLFLPFPRLLNLKQFPRHKSSHMNAPGCTPGEYPNYLSREPHPVVETSDEFREKYLFGNWRGVRSELADQGIKPLVLFITDPFVNAASGH
jgi:hypothetical protein